MAQRLASVFSPVSILICVVQSVAPVWAELPARGGSSIYKVRALSAAFGLPSPSCSLPTGDSCDGVPVGGRLGCFKPILHFRSVVFGLLDVVVASMGTVSAFVGLRGRPLVYEGCDAAQVGRVPCLSFV